MKSVVAKILAAGLVALAFGCSSSDSSNSGGSNGAGGGCCTINGTIYSCPDGASLAKCTGSSPDPSGCSHVATCTSNNSNQTAFCCGTNGAYYDCLTNAQMLNCSLGGDLTGCTARSTQCPNN